MNELELARLKRAAEKALKAQGVSNRDARIRVSEMSIAALVTVGKPKISERVRRVFGWS
jgi:hypothetical protein